MGNLTIYPPIEQVLAISNDGTKTTILGPAGDYTRFGDAVVTTQGLNSEDDVLITGKLEIAGIAFFLSQVNFRTGAGTVYANDVEATFGNDSDSRLTYESVDADAKAMLWTIDESDDSGNNVPAWIYGEETNILNVDLGLLDEVVQPHGVYIHNDGKYTSSTSGTHDGTDLDELTETGKFTNSVVGDVLRIVSGTNVTAGWYWIQDVTNNDNVNLDRNFVTGGAASDVVYVAFHGLGMITPRAFYLPIYDGAPSDSDVDINMDGAAAIDVETPRLYFRAKTAWKFITVDGGLSLTAEERIDKNGHKFELGDEVRLVVDMIREDGTFHAMPEYGGQA
ncbi:hypothetical protein LCGC14_1698680 [marine sediment metagenome]|uniref:Uncharacterized protein n=1 Tax=marine sediment metagenome TaxID=412755 RepID=A0A0F9HJ72_9ZZZZ